MRTAGVNQYSGLTTFVIGGDTAGSGLWRATHTLGNAFLVLVLYALFVQNVK